MQCCVSLAAQARHQKIFTEYKKIENMIKKLQRVALCLDACVVNGVSALYGE